jgi:hypothetical protein
MKRIDVCFTAITKCLVRLFPTIIIITIIIAIELYIKDLFFSFIIHYFVLHLNKSYLNDFSFLNRKTSLIFSSL